MNWLIRFLVRFHRPIDGNPEEFLEKPWKFGWREFIVGSCKGIYKTENQEYQILAIHNSKGGNGCFERTLKWFEDSAKRDKYALCFLEVENPKLLSRLSLLGFSGDKNKMFKTYE